MSNDKNVQLVSGLINDRIKTRGLRAADVAKRAGIHETTFSSIRNAKRKVSRDSVEAIARALSVRPEDEESEINEFLVAAGFAPQTLAERTPVLIELLNEEAILRIEESMDKGEEVWVLSRGLLETIQKRLFSVVCRNLQKRGRI